MLLILITSSNNNTRINTYTIILTLTPILSLISTPPPPRHLGRHIGFLKNLTFIKIETNFLNSEENMWFTVSNSKIEYSEKEEFRTNFTRT